MIRPLLGKKCKKCGADDWADKDHCAPCRRARRQRQYAQNKQFHDGVLAYRREYYRRNRGILNARAKVFYKANRDHILLRAQQVRLGNPGAYSLLSRIRRHGLTLDQFHAMFERQSEQCAICRAVLGFGRDKMHIDHDHTTQAVRGLLCGKCNVGIGHFSDNPELLRRAADYVARAELNNANQVVVNA